MIGLLVTGSWTRINGVAFIPLNGRAPVRGKRQQSKSELACFWKILRIWQASGKEPKRFRLKGTLRRVSPDMANLHPRFDFFASHHFDLEPAVEFHADSQFQGLIFDGLGKNYLRYYHLQNCKVLAQISFQVILLSMPATLDSSGSVPHNSPVSQVYTTKEKVSRCVFQ
jgi:hypothetical protein